MRMRIKEVKSILGMFTRTSKVLVNPNFPEYYTDIWGVWGTPKIVTKHRTGSQTKNIYKAGKLIHYIDNGFGISATDLAIMLKPPSGGEPWTKVRSEPPSRRY